MNFPSIYMLRLSYKHWACSNVGDPEIGSCEVELLFRIEFIIRGEGTIPETAKIRVT